MNFVFNLLHHGMEIFRCLFSMERYLKTGDGVTSLKLGILKQKTPNAL